MGLNCLRLYNLRCTRQSHIRNRSTQVVPESKGDTQSAENPKVRSKEAQAFDESEVPLPAEVNTKVTGKNGSLDMQGEPNSSTELYNDKGELMQRRYYDNNGDAKYDVDFSHGGNHIFPHINTWY